VRDVSLWRCLLGVEKAVIERVEFDEDAEVLVAHVRPVARERGRCGTCRRPSPGYDAGPGRRRWRTLDLGTTVSAARLLHCARRQTRAHADKSCRRGRYVQAPHLLPHSDKRLNRSTT
jgi:hypothetical protein